MSEDRYNGWKNRETWAIMLHVNNDQGLQESAEELAREAFGDIAEWEGDNMTPEEVANVRTSGICQARDAFKEWAESMFTNEGYKDEFGDRMPESLQVIAEEIGSMWRIDWYECAEALLEDHLSEFDGTYGVKI